MMKENVLEMPREKNPQKCSLLFSFFLRTLFSSENRFDENPNYVTLVPRLLSLI